MQVGDLALWKGVGKPLLVLIVENHGQKGLWYHYRCQVIEDGTNYVLTSNVLEAVCK